MKLERFNLQKIRELLSFNSLYDKNTEYMDEANSLPQIELETEPLYKLNTDTKILFTTKLRYYALRVEYEVNRYLNMVADFLKEHDDDQELTKEIIKATREEVITLIDSVKTQIYRNDYNGLLWKQAISSNPNYESFGSQMEPVAFFHYMIAQIARCWLELQDRYAYVIGKQIYDVYLFYSSFVKITPEPELNLVKTDNYNEEAKHFRKFRTDCCFLYDNEEYFAIAMQEFTNKLKENKLIPDSMDIKNMESLFRGHPTRNTISWTGDLHILTHVIKGLCKDDNPVITTWPAGTSKWDVVAARFRDSNGHPIKNNIRNESERKKTKFLVSDLINALAGYK
ncbi:MAG: hypothetical protein PUF41_02430 [Prevotella copri]|nr:hypothetical protein [Segatella copri]